MAWNDRYSRQDQDDPWTGKKRPNTPPDLDEMLRNLQKKLFNRLNVKGLGGQPLKQGSFGISMLLGFAVLLWFLSGIFIVAQGETGVILRFGRYVGSTASGIHWLPRFIERVIVVNEQKILSYPYDAEMLTRDINMVHIRLAVQYRVVNPKEALFQVTNPYESLQQATASAVRQVVGSTNLDALLTVDREKVRDQVKQVLVKILSGYHAGLLVTDVAIQEARAPDAVREAFEDVNKAQEDEKRFINQAQAYAKRVEPVARGQAQRLLADAQAYKQQVVLKAKGEVAQFLALLPQYQQNPLVTKQRLYVDALESVLSNTTKILVDIGDKGNGLYLPLDKIMAEAPAKLNKSSSSVPDAAAKPSSAKPSVLPVSAGGYDEKRGY